MCKCARIDAPVEYESSKTVEKIPGFQRAYAEDGLRVEEFDFCSTRRTLRQFISACHDLDAIVRTFMLPEPGSGLKWCLVESLPHRWEDAVDRSRLVP